MLPVVALVGRPNVGKSTLFNALTRTRDALVADRPGVTRDRHYGVWRGRREAVVVDTGGLYGEDALAAPTHAQAEAAIDEADVVVLVVDARDGLLPADRSILDGLRRRGRRAVLAVNKCDGLDEAAALAEFAALGVPASIAISAAHRRNLAQLEAAIADALPPAVGAVPVPDGDRIRIAVIGRPNVGKSTLINRLLGDERLVVSPVAGTTRDAIEVPLERDGLRCTLVDTAGVRRRGRVDDAVERLSVIKTLQAIERAQVAIVMIDASEGVTEQDASVLGHALEAGRALVIAVNKWDGLDAYQRERCRSELERRLDFVGYAARVPIAALHGSGLGELMQAVRRAWRAANWQAGTAEVTRALEIAVQSCQPPLVRGHPPKLRYAHLGGSNPPTIVVHGSRLKALKDSYKRYLENFFRRRYRLEGTPIRFEFRESDNPFEGRRNALSERQLRKRRRLIANARRGRR